MAKSIIKNVRIKGISLVLGENKISIEDEIFCYNNDEKKLQMLKNVIGCNERYIASAQTTCLDMAQCAAKRLLKELNIPKESIDAVVFGTQTPDYKFPGNAHLIHKNLELKKETFAYDVISGCGGFVLGVYSASMMINNGIKRVLLLTGDVLSKLINKKDKACVPILGDGACATLIEFDESAPDTHFILKSDGSGYDFIYCPAGGVRTPTSEETKKETEYPDGSIRSLENFTMNGLEVFGFTLFEQPKLIDEILEFANYKKEEIDYFVLHQANKYIVESVAKKAKLPKEKTPCEAFSKYGNLSQSSIPSAICLELKDKLKDRKKVLMQGFGTGLSWASCIAEFKDTVVLEPYIYKGDK